MKRQTAHELLLFIGACAAFAVLPADAWAAIVDDSGRLGNVVAIALSSDARYMAAADTHGRFTVFSRANGKPLPSAVARDTGSQIVAIGFCGQNRQLCIIRQAGLHVYDLNESKPPLGIAFSTSAAALSQTGDLLAHDNDGRLALRSLPSGRLLRVLDTMRGLPKTIGISPDGKFVAVGAQESELVLAGPERKGVADKVLEVFEVSSGQRRTFTALTPWFSATAFNADNSLIAAVAFNRTPGGPVNAYTNTALYVWSIRTAAEKLAVPLRDDTSRTTFLSFLPDRERVVMTSGGTAGGNIAIANVETGHVVHATTTLRSIFQAALDPRSNVIAIGGMMPGVELRQLPELTLLQRFGP